MNKSIFTLLSFFIVASCGSPSGPTYDLKSYDTESIGGGAKLVSYKDNLGLYLAKGQVINGVRNGTWNTFHPGTNNIKTLTTYINGRKSGAEIALDENGRIVELNEFKNDVPHGLAIKYRFGRVLEEMNYKDGQLNGPFKIYNEQAKLQRSGSFKNGKQHGLLQYYDDNGNVTLEYTYENGEKVSGGIVQPSVEETQ